jgi:glucose/arabinose dehydrogenase
MSRRLVLIAVMSLLTGACASGGNSVTAPLKVTVSGAPNGIAVRETDGAVFVTDDTISGIAMTPDIADASAAFSPYASIPATPGGRTSLSQIAFGPNGHLLVERFGFGKSSAVFDVAANGQVSLASATNPERRRLGLVVLDGGTFLSSWFAKEGEAAPAGGVSMITRGETPGSVIERDIVSGLGKPVGLAVVDDTLFISDQAANRIVKVDLLAARTANAPIEASDVFANVDEPDLLAAAPDGALYTKCGAHALCKFSKRGRMTVLADDFDSPRGVAVDVARKRIVAVDRASARDQPSHVRVWPLR